MTVKGGDVPVVCQRNVSTPQNGAEEWEIQPAATAETTTNALAGQCRTAMEIACQTDVEYDTVIFNWRVNNFNRMRVMAQDKGIPPEGDVITSPIYVDVSGGQWWLRLYPYEDRPEHRGKVSLFLHTDRAIKGDVFFSFNFSALDADGHPVEETAGGMDMHKFGKSDGIRNFGFYDLIESQELIDRCLVDGHALWLLCEVHIFASLVTSLDEVQDIKQPVVVESPDSANRQLTDGAFPPTGAPLRPVQSTAPPQLPQVAAVASPVNLSVVPVPVPPVTPSAGLRAPPAYREGVAGIASRTPESATISAIDIKRPAGVPEIRTYTDLPGAVIPVSDTIATASGLVRGSTSLTPGMTAQHFPMPAYKSTVASSALCCSTAQTNTMVRDWHLPAARHDSTAHVPYAASPTCVPGGSYASGPQSNHHIRVSQSILWQPSTSNVPSLHPTPAAQPQSQPHRRFIAFCTANRPPVPNTTTILPPPP